MSDINKVQRRAEGTTPNRENIRKWVKALRSGEYKQTQKRLATVDRDGNVSYCCLGVACEVYGKTERREQELNQHSRRVVFDGSDAVLPESVQQWLGLTEGHPGVLSDRTYSDGELVPEGLAVLNDDRGWDFDQIADAIERTWLK